MNTRDAAPDLDLLGFAQKLMAVLDQGLTSATYKYAVLLGLLDLCLEQTSAAGTPPAMVTTAQLADKVIELYWPQARPHPAADGALAQNAAGQAEIVSRIAAYRGRAELVAALSARDARRFDPDGYRGLRRFVEFKLAEMPLPRLQRVGSGVDEFLYRVAFQEPECAVTRRRDLDDADFDNRILFVGRAAEHLVSLSPILRPLVQREWTALVARFNRFPEAGLEDFLFGSTRTPTRTLQRGLRDLQENRCFYCGDRLAKAEVDHFVPWARYADDGLDNLVLADARCNNRKRAHLAATEHVERWAGRFHPGSAVGSGLGELARTEGWDREPSRTLGVARGVYLLLPPSARLWKLGDDFETADLARIAASLAA